MRALIAGCLLLAACASAPDAAEEPEAPLIVLRPEAPARPVVRPVVRPYVAPAVPVAPSVAPAPEAQAAAVPPVPPVPPALLTIATLSPAELLVAAEQARRDATSYVAWRKSLPENINRLNTLTQALNISVARMVTNESGGTYRAPDIIAVRTTLRALLSFLATKGD